MTTTAPAPVGGGTGRRRWWALGVISLAQLLVIIDMTIMTIALPSAQQDLGMSDTARQWAITAYTVAFGGLLLLGGRLADRLGRRNTLLAGVVGFALASALGGAAGSTEMLLAARALQGVFAALLAPSTLSLLTITFSEPRERARVFGVFGAIMMSGAAIGLLAGGALAEYLGWRWCLYVNLPIAVVAAVAGWFVLPHAEAHRDARLDWLSAVLGGGAIVSLVYGLAEAAERGFGSGLVLGSLAVAAVLVAAFAVRQARTTGPLLPPAILTDRSRAAGFLAVGVAAFGMFGMFLFLTFQLQTIMGYGPLRSGLAFLPLIGANVLAATQLTGRLSARYGPRPLLGGGLLLLAAGLFTLTWLTAESSYAGLILPAEVVLGLGAGLTMPTVINLATAGVAPRAAGAASAFVTTSQQVGASLGTATLNTIATAATTSMLADPSGTGDPAAATVHGFATASGWGAAVLAAGAVAVVALYRRPPQVSPAPH
ncbi:EmrB/QacA subfamily drug resistance transporter [Prauserella shujinwangii]|uniref:EmrB/QacA subfamily drug resistance transporter n=1 Tax=Prauserella shujinwangii TaxID=1453103 RepID=A0A2T0M085_9PSEU|nr:MFS transporter [Prauserella shujinwangii]PRX49977.1 EmrB/QacA subfamily drug resistance transporter [Prauserella shujinwangii]